MAVFSSQWVISFSTDAELNSVCVCVRASYSESISIFNATSYSYSTAAVSVDGLRLNRSRRSDVKDGGHATQTQCRSRAHRGREMVNNCIPTHNLKPTQA